MSEARLILRLTSRSLLQLFFRKMSELQYVSESSRVSRLLPVDSDSGAGVVEPELKHIYQNKLDTKAYVFSAEMCKSISGLNK